MKFSDALLLLDPRFSQRIVDGVAAEPLSDLAFSASFSPYRITMMSMLCIPTSRAVCIPFLHTWSEMEEVTTSQTPVVVRAVAQTA